MRIGFIRDGSCRISEMLAYQSDDDLGAKSVLFYDNKNNPISVIQYLNDGSVLGKRKFEYEFDNQGNWIKRSDFALKEEKGKSDWKLMNVAYRKIEYFDNK